MDMDAALVPTQDGAKNMTTITKLQSDLFSTGINALTRQEISEGFLEAGMLVRDACEIGEKMSFLASTDGGKCWYEERASAAEFKAAAPDAAIRVINF